MRAHWPISTMTLSFLRLHACGWVLTGGHVSDAWCVTGPKSCALIGQWIADSRVEAGKARTLVESDLKSGAHWWQLLGLIHFWNRIRFPVADSKLVLSCLILSWTQCTLQDFNRAFNTDYTIPSRRSPRLPIYDRNLVLCGGLSSTNMFCNYAFKIWLSLTSSDLVSVELSALTELEQLQLADQQTVPLSSATQHVVQTSREDLAKDILDHLAGIRGSFLTVGSSFVQQLHQSR